MNRMSASDWTLAQDGTSLTFCRGFTGHEHYGCFGIINMNARLYDPVIGRFFSPDPQVQNPFSTQGFNRYSYCGNNPIMYIDEDGEFALWLAMFKVKFDKSFYNHHDDLVKTKYGYI